MEDGLQQSARGYILLIAQVEILSAAEAASVGIVGLLYPQGRRAAYWIGPYEARIRNSMPFPFTT
jgi:hypothetical protein